LSLFRRLSIQSQLILMLLLVAVSSIMTLGWIAYSSGREALTTAAFNQLTSVRASKKVQIEAFFKTIRNQVSNLADDRMIITALQEMTVGFDKFKRIEIKPEWDQKLRAFYRDDFLPKLAKSTGKTPRLEAFFPTTPEARYAQYLYIATNPYPSGKRYELKDAGDGSEFSAAHGRYQGIFSKLVQDFGYDNLILIDQAGDVVYTFTKSPLFGTNLLEGPYSETNAGNLFKALRKSSNVDDVQVEDFAPQSSAQGKPVGLMGAAVFDGPKQIGVIFLQFPVDEINRVMTDNFGWVQDGLGRTGEVFLVGSDMLMRSRSRLLHEDPDRYFKELENAGYAPDDINRVRRFGTATLAQPVRTKAAETALAGKTGTAVLTNYRGVSVLASFAPLYVSGLRWVVIAEMDTNEAFDPLTALTRRILISSLTMILIVTVVAAGLGRRFVRPIFRLLDGVHRLEAGEKNVAIDIGSADEFADLGEAFNHMSHSLTTTGDTLAQRTIERDGLLDNVLPPAAAERMKQGHVPAIDEYAEISVLYANFLALAESSWSRDAEKSLGILNDLVVAIDDAAERRGVEKLSSSGATYVACCGLSRQRLDHASRIIDFAQDLLRIIRQLNREREIGLRVQIGIESGSAAGGVVGRVRFSYHLVGESMAMAGALASQAPTDGILVGPQIYAATRNLYHFGSSIQIAPSSGDSIAAWPLKSTDGRVPRGGEEPTTSASSGDVESIIAPSPKE
jgi:class 3 adenylate cyclase